MCGWFSAQRAQQDSRFDVWTTPSGGQVAVTAVLECDGLRDATRQPEGEFRGPVTRWLRTEHAPGRTQDESFPWTGRYQPQTLAFYRPEDESFGGTTQGTQPLRMIDYDAEVPTTPPAATRSELVALVRQRQKQLIAAQEALVEELERASALASTGAGDTVFATPQEAADRRRSEAVARHVSRWDNLDAGRGAGPGQWRTPLLARMGIPTEYEMYGEGVDPDYSLAARAVYALRGAIEAIRAVEATRHTDDGRFRRDLLLRSDVEKGKQQAQVAERRVLLALEDLSEAKATPGADVAQAQAAFDDALATAADVVSAIKDMLAFHGF